MQRLRIHPYFLSCLVALYLVILFNRSFWARAVDYFHYDYGLLALIFVILSGLFIALNVVFSVKYLLKIWLILLIFTGAAASWFTDQFGTIIDRHMLVNTMETTVSESTQLITPNFILYLVLTALVPSVIIVWLQPKYYSLLGAVWRNVSVILVCLLVALGLALSVSRPLMSGLREHNDLVRILNPVAPMVSLVKYVNGEYLQSALVFEPVGLDAKIVRASRENNRPRIIIVVVGEAARAENFAFQGYERQTNPQLSRRNVLYFGNTASCGTSTAQSVPCMFSHLRRDEFDRHRANAMSSLPDILAHIGIDVQWLENNSDSKGVAERIPQVIFYGREMENFCVKGECLDGIMLESVDEWLESVKGDGMLFVHQMGSHGPAYFKRYTEEFRQFQPDCRGVEFSQCSMEEVRNAYDNSLLYTDDFLSQLIDKLAARADTIDAGLFYMSDHGQSLGENGLYLHGMPYALAPSQQKHIPFVLWLSPQLTGTLELDLTCLTKDAMSRPLSHDNLFPSLLGIMEVETELKDEALDMVTPCRRSHREAGR